MSNNKQSSVAWIISQLCKIDTLHDFGEIGNEEYSQLYLEIIEQAKEMHKEEIKTSMSVAFLDGLRSGDENYKAPHEDWEDYYIKAFDN